MHNELHEHLKPLKHNVIFVLGELKQNKKTGIFFINILLIK